MILDKMAKAFGRGLRFIDWGGGRGRGGHKTKDPDFVFKVPFLRLQAGAVISFTKRNAARTTRTSEDSTHQNFIGPNSEKNNSLLNTILVRRQPLMKRG